jgi:hypothetical protein
MRHIRIALMLLIPVIFAACGQSQADDLATVVFRNLEPYPPGAPGADDYWRIPLSVFIDAQTGVVLRQTYI